MTTTAYGGRRSGESKAHIRCLGRRFLRYGILLLAVIAAACGGSPTSPTGEAESFAWTVNGQSFAASSNGRGALRTGSVLALLGGDCGSGANMSINVRNLSVGTYEVGPGAATVSWAPDTRTGQAAQEAWNAPGTSRVVGNAIVTGGSGSVTISSISSDWVSGSFSAVVVANPSNRDAGSKTVQGSFQLSFRERTIC